MAKKPKMKPEENVNRKKRRESNKKQLPLQSNRLVRNKIKLKEKKKKKLKRSRKP